MPLGLLSTCCCACCLKRQLAQRVSYPTRPDATPRAPLAFCCSPSHCTRPSRPSRRAPPGERPCLDTHYAPASLPGCPRRSSVFEECRRTSACTSHAHAVAVVPGACPGLIKQAPHHPACNAPVPLCPPVLLGQPLPCRGVARCRRAGLTEAQRRIVEGELRDFVLGGVALEVGGPALPPWALPLPSFGSSGGAVQRVHSGPGPQGRQAFTPLSRRTLSRFHTAPLRPSRARRRSGSTRSSRSSPSCPPSSATM